MKPYCCGVAAILYSLQPTIGTKDQEEIIEKFKPSFPSWGETPGKMTPIEALNLIDLLLVDHFGHHALEDFIATKNIAEAGVIRRTYAGLYWTRFAFFLNRRGQRVEQNHFLAVVATCPGILVLMNPGLGEIQGINNEQHQRAEGAILLCFERSNQ